MKTEFIQKDECGCFTHSDLSDSRVILSELQQGGVEMCDFIDYHTVI